MLLQEWLTRYAANSTSRLTTGIQRLVTSQRTDILISGQTQQHNITTSPGKCASSYKLHTSLITLIMIASFRTATHYVLRMFIHLLI